MVATGIVRQLDNLGRIVIPIELRRTMGIGEKDALEIFTDGDRIMLRKYTPGCLFCGGLDIKLTLKGKPICTACTSQFVNENIASDLK
ncbi:AbrB/MazE/SpoVT family DNA-binding domain-containing protein [Paenibacillus sp. GYB004]|uniref:AbrB/MazE/SpoVT family DNA-binding domain-containing protein n=1 Tax=Paenibacillus sp. GYB004 TaxID=2994393 RepID=UPI002F962F26